MDTGLTPTTVVRLDVATGAPVVVDVLRTDNANGAGRTVCGDRLRVLAWDHTESPQTGYGRSYRDVPVSC